jgi:predicted glycoside hydrolase/deacetylase ChbG (UPF0249 family)
MPRYLIVNADDFGHTPGVSQGILRAHREGIVTSTSVMINKPAAAEAIRLAQHDAPRLGLGLHLNLTSGKPVLPADDIPDLVQADGTFHRPPELMPRLATIDMLQVEQELRAQVARFIEQAGRSPDHLDSHHNSTYMSPSIASLMLQLATELSVPVRNSFPTLEYIQEDPSAGLTPHAVGEIAARVAASGVLMPDHFVYHFYDERATLGDLLNVLVDVPEGVTELMCHPAVVDEAIRAASVYAERRSDELAALTHPSVHELIAAQGLQLISFGGLSDAGGSLQ